MKTKKTQKAKPSKKKLSYVRRLKLKVNNFHGNKKDSTLIYKALKTALHETYFTVNKERQILERLCDMAAVAANKPVLFDVEDED